MSRYCLDTSAYSRFRRGDDRVVALLDSAEWVGVPAIALGELRTGFELGSRRGANEAALQAFLSNPVVVVLTVDDAVSRHYARIVATLRTRGTPLPTNDVWVAATAARAGAPVLTYDTHFRDVDGVATLVLE